MAETASPSCIALSVLAFVSSGNIFCIDMLSTAFKRLVRVFAQAREPHAASFYFMNCFSSTEPVNDDPNGNAQRKAAVLAALQANDPVGLWNKFANSGTTWRANLPAQTLIGILSLCREDPKAPADIDSLILMSFKSFDVSNFSPKEAADAYRRIGLPRHQGVWNVALRPPNNNLKPHPSLWFLEVLDALAIRPVGSLAASMIRIWNHHDMPMASIRYFDKYIRNTRNDFVHAAILLAAAKAYKELPNNELKIRVKNLRDQLEDKLASIPQLATKTEIMSSLLEAMVLVGDFSDAWQLWETQPEVFSPISARSLLYALGQLKQPDSLERCEKIAAVLAEQGDGPRKSDSYLHMIHAARTLGATGVEAKYWGRFRKNLQC